MVIAMAAAAIFAALAAGVSAVREPLLRQLDRMHDWLVGDWYVGYVEE